MAISIEQLEEEGQDKDAIIIVGQNILLKFIQGKSLLSQNRKLQKVIEIPNLLSAEETLATIREISKNSRLLKETLGEYVQDWTPQANQQVLQKHRDRIIELSEKIGEGEQKISLAISEPHYFAFCNSCNAFVGETDNLTTKCPECNTQIDDSNRMRVSHLDKTATGFLDGGIWFEDYMDRLLTQEGWKVWTHGSVMGMSGVLHPIDILAIKEGRTLLAECKAGGVGPKDISHFITQKSDIPSHFGLFLSLKDCSSKNTASLFKGKLSILVDQLEGKNDQEIIDCINKGLDKFW